MAEWEVSIVVDEASRYPVGRASDQAGLQALVLEANHRIASGDYPHPVWKTGAVLVQRADCTSEARREAWEAAFYDIDKRGYRRRRYKRTPLEKEWEEFFVNQRKAVREASRIRNAERG